MGFYLTNLGYRMDPKKRETHGQTLEHRIIVEERTGIKLKPSNVVHHHNENRSDNGPGNLVVCEDNAYHYLLHARMRAKAACGNANWKKCGICKEYDDPKNLVKHKSRHYFYHKACHAARVKAARHAKRKEG